MTERNCQNPSCTYHGIPGLVRDWHLVKPIVCKWDSRVDPPPMYFCSIICIQDWTRGGLVHPPTA